jgi:hypothetical protein
MGTLTKAFALAVALLAAPALAGNAGKDPACIRQCGTELGSCQSQCTSTSSRCGSECGLDLTCRNACADDLNHCQENCTQWNRECTDACPEKEEK